ncbi:MAG: NAD(+) diphosphatase [Pseudoxanthomonas suwonensis]|nr:NAD(+) diphosphatase [Pseudoxanthomonas suwonensis]
MDAPTPFAFVDAPLDRADALRDAPGALQRLWPEARVLRVDPAGCAPCDGDGQAHWLNGGDIATAVPADAVFLGMDGYVGWFALPTDERLVDGVDLRSAAGSWSARDATAFAQARAVLHWRDSHRHCAFCAAPLTYSRGGWQGDCRSCGRTHYPRSDPAVIVAVSDGERLLLGRQASWPALRYSTLAGFVEPGETLEQTVVREVLEESGVRVLGSRYLASQPWPFPGSLMLGFVAHALPDAPQAREELEDARWFNRAQVGRALADDSGACGLKLSPPLSISRWLIQRWHDGERA